MNEIRPCALLLHVCRLNPRVGQSEKQLTGQRGEARVFASLDTAAAQLLALA